MCKLQDYIMEGKKLTKVTIEDLEEYNLIVLKEFGSEEEGFRFYNSYTEGKGFSVRKDIVKRDPTTGRIVRRRYYCSREGYRRIQFFDLPNRQKEPRPLTHCGCEAKFEIELNEETGR